MAACNWYCTDLDHVGAASPDIPMDNRNADALHVMDEYAELELGAQDDRDAQDGSGDQFGQDANTKHQDGRRDHHRGREEQAGIRRSSR